MTYTISTAASSAVIDSLGAEMLSFKVGGAAYLHDGDARYWTGHAPILFPFVSALKDGKTEIDGVTYYADKKHGFARKTEFTPVEVSGNKAVFKLTESAETLATYPYRFELYITHTLSADGFTTSMRVVNPTDGDIMFGIGGHPAFALGAPVDECHIEFTKDEDADIYAVDEKGEFSTAYTQPRRYEGRRFDLRYGDFDVDALICTSLKSDMIRYVRNDGERGVEFGFEGFPVLLLWTPPMKKAPFLCLEPWYGMPPAVDEKGTFAERAYTRTLKGGDSFECAYTVRAI